MYLSPSLSLKGVQEYNTISKYYLSNIDNLSTASRIWKLTKNYQHLFNLLVPKLVQLSSTKKSILSIKYT
jgi:hypothetical protein